MKTEELLVRYNYDYEYQWICTNCKQPLRKYDIRWGEWRNGSGYYKNFSRCCNASVRVRV